VFWLALAQGEADRATAPGAIAAALRDGFRGAPLPIGLQTLLDQNRKGEAVLRAFDLFAQGADGNLDELQNALGLLRAVGLDRAARRAALHLLILGARP